MIELAPDRRLRKEIRLLDLYAVSTGATLSAGFFLLPGIAARQAGTGLVFAYLLAALPMIPAMFSIVELATAMPRAGGVYYFLDRSLGPMIGTIGGLGTWCALVLKVAFALIGMGAYIALFFPELHIVPIAIGLAVALGILNLLGAKKTGAVQRYLVAGLLAILSGFIGHGLLKLDPRYLRGFFDAGFDSLLGTAGLVYISYVGVTKVASLSEEVSDPERNLPRAVFLSLGTAIAVYGLGTLVMVGVVPLEQLSQDLTPAATAAEAIFGRWGRTVIAVAALLAFVSVANAGTLSASRYPLAMSRDRMLPKFMSRIDRSGTPVYGVLLTMGVIVAVLLFLDPIKIAKLASAFQLMIFAFVCLAVIVMRESHLRSYDPGYPSPLYPWMQIFGILAPFVLISEMGRLSVLFSVGLIAVGVGWFFFYARDRVEREGAIYHFFERLGRRRYDGLDQELRGILKEKGLRREDPFDEIVSRSLVIDAHDGTDFESLVDEVSALLSRRIRRDAEELRTGFLQGTRVGATPVTHGVALPHLRIRGLRHAEMVLVRSQVGISITLDETNPTGFHRGDQMAHAAFFLVSPDEDPGLHLRILAQIAGRVDEDGFETDWHGAGSEHELKEVLLRDERFITLRIRKRRSTAPLIGCSLRDLQLPEGALVTVIQREGKAIVPSGNTVIEDGDRVTLIGTPERIRELHQRFKDAHQAGAIAP